MQIFINFFIKHGERLIFMLLALALATLLFQLDMKAEAKVIYIGAAMMCFNKMRSPEAPDPLPEPKIPEPADPELKDPAGAGGGPES